MAKIKLYGMFMFTNYDLKTLYLSHCPPPPQFLTPKIDSLIDKGHQFLMYVHSNQDKDIQKQIWTYICIQTIPLGLFFLRRYRLQGLKDIYLFVGMFERTKTSRDMCGHVGRWLLCYKGYITANHSVYACLVPKVDRQSRAPLIVDKRIERLLEHCPSCSDEKEKEWWNDEQKDFFLVDWWYT